jgi:hypothetical protein
MNRPPAGRRAATWAWLKAHPYSLAAAAVLLALAVPFCRRADSEWEEVYLPAARRLARGEALYRAEENYLYPPFMAWAALPFADLPPRTGRLAWLAVNLACGVFLVRGAWRLAGGGPLQGAVPAPRTEHLAALLGGACGVCSLQNCLAHQQTDVAIGALLVGGCLLLARGRALAAVTCFGLAAACKCTPLLWLPYFLCRRRPGAAAWLACVALGANLLPDLLAGPPPGRPRLVDYADRFVLPLARSDRPPGTWGSELIYNQSLSGSCQRWLSTTWVWGAADCTLAPRPGAPAAGALRGVAYGTGLLLLLGAAWAAGRPLRRVGEAKEGEVGAQALECGMLLALALLLSPMSGKAHFGVLLVPGFCLARAALRGRDRLAGALLAAAVSLALLGNKDLLGNRLYTLSLWYGATTWEALLLLLGCGAVLSRHRRAAAAPGGRRAEGPPLAA